MDNELRQKQEQRQISRAYMERHVDLQNESTVAIFLRTYDDCNMRLYNLAVTIRFMGTNEQSEGVNKLVDQMFSDFMREIEEQRDQLAAIIETHGVDYTEILYTNPQAQKAMIFSPKSIRLLEIYQEMDKLLLMATAAWMFGVINDQQYAKANKTWKYKVLSFTGRINAMTIKAIRQARRSLAQRQEAEEKKKAEKEKAKTEKKSDAQQQEAA